MVGTQRLAAEGGYASAMRWGLAGIAGRGAALAAILVLVGCGDPAAPIVTTAELRIQQIYDAGEWLQRVPVQYAAAFYVRSTVESFLDDLDLPDEIRTRVSARLDAEDFVDELIPFVLFLRDMYVEPEDEGAEGFDRYLRQHFAPEDDIPGITHDMFAWEPEESESEGAELPGLAPGIARELVTLYDALYLRDRPPASSVEDRLACESREAGPALESATRAAMPPIRALVAALRDQMSAADESGTESEIADGLQGLLDDDVKLEAASAAVVRFVDQTVCRNYRFFASRAFRARQLERWMHRELDAPAGGLLWQYLEQTSRERRYGALIVVDGLQGRLMEALAGGTAEAPFIQAVVAEQAAGGGPAPKARSLRSPVAQQTRFLSHFARQGFEHDHYLPFFKGLLHGSRVAWIPVGISTTPTISVRNIPISLTGAAVAGPHGTGLPNFHFVDRGYTRAGEQRGRAYYFFGSDAVDLVSLTRRAGMRTLAERLPHLTSLSCTAQYDESFQFGYDALLNLGLGERLRDFGDRLCAAELMRRAHNELDLDRLRQKLLARRKSIIARHGWWELWQQYGQSRERDLVRIRLTEIARLEQHAMPELFVYYNPWPDHFAHFEGPFADEIISPSGELNRLDYWLRRVQRAYELARVNERTLFGMAGDHGLSPVFHLLNPEVEIFDALREEGVDFRVVKISSDEGEGPKLTNPFDPPTMKGIDVVVASTAGGNYMLDLFLDQDAHFSVQPLARDLRAVRPLGAAQGTRAVDLLDEITRRLADSLDYLAVREAPCGPERCQVRVMATREGTPASGSIRREGTRVHYAFEAADLLDTQRASPYEAMSDAEVSAHAELRSRCLDAPVDDPSRWCEEAEWRRLTSFTSRPDSVVQLAHLYDVPHAGTVNLFPRNGVGYNSRVPGRHAGESFHEKNAFVALWGPAVLSDAELPRSAEGGSVPMAIFEWLSGTEPVRGQDGWGFARLDGILAGSD